MNFVCRRAHCRQVGCRPARWSWKRNKQPAAYLSSLAPRGEGGRRPGEGFRDHWRFLVIAAVFLSFTLDSFARYPIPGPNESHYLCKAKHYWNPEWCARDLFLSSSNAHLVFYQTFGLLTR